MVKWTSTITSHKLGPLNTNCHSVILWMLVFQRRIWGSIPLYAKYQLTNYPRGKRGGYVLDLVVEIREGTTSRGWLVQHCCMWFIHKSMCSRGYAVSPVRRGHLPITRITKKGRKNYNPRLQESAIQQ